jgi:regulator of replication initiation timing
MDSVQNIITNIFGGEFTFQSIANAIVPLYAVVMSIKEAIATRRLIKADKELNATEKQVTKLREENSELRTAIGVFGDIICTAYLANPNVDEQTKKKIAVAATKLDEVAKIPLADMSRELIDTVTKYVPGTNLEAKKEAIVAEVARVEEKIDGTVEDVSDIIKNLEV